MQQGTTVPEIPSDSKEAAKRKRHGMLRNILQEFGTTSSLHGLHYISEQERSRFEKVFWATVTVVSLFLGLWSCSKIWLKWQDSPIIISVNDRLMSVSEVPFPAVTICPQNKLKVLNFSEAYIVVNKHFQIQGVISYVDENGTSHTVDQRKEKFESFKKSNQSWLMKKLFAASFVCKKTDLLYDLFDSEDNQGIVDHIMQDAPSFKELIEEGSWRNEEIYRWDLEEFFAPVLTAEGLCFTFNGLAADEIFNMDRIHTKYNLSGVSFPSRNWTFERGYLDESNSRDTNVPTDRLYPRRGEDISADKSDLHLLLADDSPYDAGCSGSFEGFKVYLHHPAEMPQRANNFYAAQPEHLLSLKVKVNVITTSDSLINYSPRVRQCYFPTERTLKYFKVYTPSNCELECRTNYTLERCRCVWFHMPHNSTTTICTSPDNVYCFKEADGKFSTSDNWLGVNGCQCLPLCHSIQYEAETSKTVQKYKSDRANYVASYYKIQPNYILNPRTLNYERYAYTGIEVGFKEPRFVTLQRSELYGFMDFLSACGGLLGLFLGFSFLSLIELVYFFTLRLYYKLKREKKSDKQHLHAKEQDGNTQAQCSTRF